MINVKLKVVFTDGTDATVKTGPATQVAFERQFNLSLLEAFQADRKMHLEWVYFLAWHASSSSTGFDDWLRTITEVEVEGSDTPDPSPAAP